MAAYISKYMEKTVPLPIKYVIVFTVLPSAVFGRR